LYVRRYREGGADGLEDRSRRPLASPRRCTALVEAEIVGLRQAHPHWGGRKLARRLSDLGVANIPSPSTVTEVLRRHGLLDAAEAIKHAPYVRFERPAPNELWQMDFKGHIAIDTGRCHPLTVLDDHCRFSVGLFACGDETQGTVQGHLTGLFRRYGLPVGILCDNGSPWRGCGAVGYSALAVWLMRVGVRMHHGRPYHPQTQGKDERFHRTLKVELLQGRRFADLARCQSAFDAWRRIYNEQRPHEALGLAVPASRYCASPVSFPEHLPLPAYAETDAVRRVGTDGSTNFKGRRVKLSQAFVGQSVAFRPTARDGVWKIFFMRFGIGEIDLTVDPTAAKAHEATVRDVSEQV
jgi:transposase InsO family protein